MPKRKQVIPIEDQITDYFDSAPKDAVETLLRVCTRVVGRRFPPVVEAKGVKGNGSGKGATKANKAGKSALGSGLNGPQVGGLISPPQTGSASNPEVKENQDAK